MRKGRSSGRDKSCICSPSRHSQKSHPVICAERCDFVRACSSDRLVVVLRLVVSVLVVAGCAHQPKPGELYWRGDLDEPRIALTFDDGPNEPYTSQILAILAQYDVRATFFLVGRRVEKLPDSARAIVAGGHAIGNHSYTHPDMSWEDEPSVEREVEFAEAAIAAATGVRPRIFRAPFGSVYPIMLHEAEHLGYVMIQWSVAAHDWLRPGAQRIAQRILAHTHNGAIILLHDGDGAHGGDRSQTVEALKLIIPELKRRGYEFVTVPELLNIKN